MSFIAPCGHPGEAIIGTFVRCLQGCGSANKPTPVSARRTPGHVEMCACKPCQIRRSVATIVLRSKDGKEVATVPWDGVKNRLLFKSTKTDVLRHWRMLTGDGEEVASGLCDYDIGPGDVALDLTLFMDKHLKLTITQVTKGSTIHAADWYSARKGLLSGYLNIHSYSHGGTEQDIINAALRVGGVHQVTVTSTMPGEVCVDVMHYTGALRDIELVNAVESEVYKVIGASVRRMVVGLKTPGHVMLRALKRVEQEVCVGMTGKPFTDQARDSLSYTCKMRMYTALMDVFGMDVANTLTVSTHYSHMTGYTAIRASVKFDDKINYSARLEVR